jgi:hypothetical protein
MTAAADWVLIIAAIGGLWCGSLYLWPFGPCPRCKGTGVNRGSNGRRFGQCKRCRGQRRVQRRGSRTLHRAVWMIRGERSRIRQARRDRDAAQRAQHPRYFDDDN